MNHQTRALRLDSDGAESMERLSPALLGASIISPKRKSDHLDQHDEFDSQTPTLRSYSPFPSSSETLRAFAAEEYDDSQIDWDNGGQYEAVDDSSNTIQGLFPKVTPDYRYHSNFGDDALREEEIAYIEHSQRIERPVLTDIEDFPFCYGMLHRATARLVGDMATVQKNLESDDTPRVGSHFQLGIESFDGHLYVNIPNALRIAQLNIQMTETLKPFVESQDILLRPLAHEKTILEHISTATKSKEANTTLNINLYARHDPSTTEGQRISRRLSDNKVWLQLPDWQEPNTTYHNPHFLPINGHPMEATQLTSGKHVEADQNIGIEASLNEVYSMLTRDSHLKGIAGDNRLKTPLLPHQEKALEFMSQRESGPVPEEYRGWEAHEKDGQTWYHHTISNVKSKTLPLDTGGGILADEMGLGKTFSTLALVVKTLEDAHRWSTDSTTHLEESIPRAMRLSRATLVVVPSPLLLKTWTSEIEKRLNIQLKTLLHHGDKRSSSIHDLHNNDIVLTTYHTLIAEEKKGQSPIAGIAWYRVVLDEAHFVRRASTSLHKRVEELIAKFRWCLTGTPIQNRLDDIGTLFKFLQIYPFSRLSAFRQCVTVPYKDGRRRHAQENLAKIIDSMCLRRTKALIGLSRFQEMPRYITFTQDEWLQYDQTKSAMWRTMHNRVNHHVNSARFGQFQAQLQLRLICNHGTFQQQYHWNRAHVMTDLYEIEQGAEESMYALRNGEIECSNCQDIVGTTDVAQAAELGLSCRHILCSDCRIGSLEQCPICELRITTQSSKQSRYHDRSAASREHYFRKGGYSSKMSALITDLSHTSMFDKSIVFSQWTTTLDLVQRHLIAAGMSFERVDGMDDFRHRQKVLDRFRDDPGLPILIMTTGVGAYGLDLTAANRVFLMEPQWNPSVELQAIGRTLRIGQEREVTVTRYLVQDTVEKDMQDLQRTKLNLAGMAKMNDSMESKPFIKREPGV